MSNCSSAFSIIESTSPIPKILDAILSGWNSSISFNFSPVPINFIGFPVIFLIESAAPPRVSPSSFVSTIPSIDNSSLNFWATFTASWPIIESTTNKISSGWMLFFSSFNSFINVSSIWSLPAVSTKITSHNLLIATSFACFAILTTFFSFSFAYTGILSSDPITCNCLMAAGLYTSHATIRGFFPCFLNKLAILPHVVVLPEPCKPTIMIIVGSFWFGLKFILLSFPPSKSTNSSLTILITCCPGVKDFNTSCPNALSCIFPINSLTTL